ncbi:MAG TPA: hypothetical protein VFL83_22615 [Anaeromyxobacter sp.]|nr:hypothetical protein [Anaeromyxobacter sp.]
MQWVAYGVAAVAIVVMALNVVQAIRLRRAIVGGEVGAKWSLLTVLIGFFFVGYLFSPLAIYFRLPKEILDLMMFAVFLFGAVFVLYVIGIIRDTLAFLKLVK